MADATSPPSAISGGVEVVRGIIGLRPELGRLLVAVGVFDGLHRGHASLLRALVREAHARAARPAVLTFDAHPDEIVRGVAPPLLLDPDERLVRLARAGVEVVIVVHFDATLRRTPYDAFVRSIAELVELGGFVMTPDAAFGFERRGTPAALAALGASGEPHPPFEVVVVEPYQLDGRSVRSSEVREAVAAGRLDDARRLLGRRHALVGDVGPDGRVVFGVPVALPPAGRYRASVGPASSLDTGAVARARDGLVEVGADGRVRLVSGPPAPGGRRVRVAFAAPRLPGP
jgi:riboflavin kinase/FMN adenylyltransferase